MKFELEESREDLRRSAKALGRETITTAEYEKVGQTHPTTIRRRFGSWSKALELADLEPGRFKIGITDDELFENIKSLWITLGRQPRHDEVKAPSSQFHAATYKRRFGSWSMALHRFVAWVTQTPKISVNKTYKKSKVQQIQQCKLPRKSAGLAGKYQIVKDSES